MGDEEGLGGYGQGVPSLDDLGGGAGRALSFEKLVVQGEKGATFTDRLPGL